MHPFRAYTTQIEVWTNLFFQMHVIFSSRFNTNNPKTNEKKTLYILIAIAFVASDVIVVVVGFVFLSIAI